ncbi:hypothetical protein Cgig2_021006 [Carnegiea gigantea]|uniref:PB1 domain-containing protein n=1 Tax=Carnegiea gigantea TaxID=171969 RepID=A0A9Q1KAZ8_9CARY|nr:hypothetical protein Cgig2_021006 [Carnegiea gigantea]
MDVNAAVAGEGGRGREIFKYVLWGGMLAKSGDGKVTYEGGSRKCMVVKEGMGVEELMKMVREMTRSDMLEEKLWYSLKYDREMLVAVEGDSDMKAIFKGNNEHGYMYVTENGGPVRRAQEKGAVYEGRVNCRSSGSEGGELSASRLQLGGDTIEISDHDEISVVSEDAGDEEATKEDDADSNTGGHIQPTCAPMEMHDMGIVDGKTGLIVGGEELDEDYNRCILPPNNGRHPSRPPSKQRES